MSNTECEKLNWLLGPLGFGVVISLCLPSLEYITLLALTLSVIAAHIHYGVEVVSDKIVFYLFIANNLFVFKKIFSFNLKFFYKIVIKVMVFQIFTTKRA